MWVCGLIWKKFGSPVHGTAMTVLVLGIRTDGNGPGSCVSGHDCLAWNAVLLIDENIGFLIERFRMVSQDAACLKFDGQS